MKTTMETTIKRIDLKKFRGNNSTLFTGRPQGLQARIELGLDELDNNNNNNNNLIVVFEIPEETTSFNPSFYLGLLYKSYKTLGIEGFSNKYSFDIKTNDLDTKKVILENLKDGMRNALNELNKKTGLWSFITSKK